MRYLSIAIVAVAYAALIYAVQSTTTNGTTVQAVAFAGAVMSLGMALCIAEAR